jgi:hypothetical protein
MKKVRLLFLTSYINTIFLGRWIASFFKTKDSNMEILYPAYLGQFYRKSAYLYVSLLSLILIGVPFFVFFYNTVQFAKTIYNFFFIQKNKSISEKLFIYSRFMFKTSKRINLFTRTDSVLVFPNEKCSEIDIKQQVTIYDLITFKNIISTYCNSFIIFGLVIKYFGYANSLYSLNFFKFSLMYNGLLNIDLNTEIYMNNQKDRWAFLIDKLPHKKKIIIQHGTNYFKNLPNPYSKEFIKYDKEDDLYTLVMPIKLSNIWKIYAFTQTEAKYMLVGEHKNIPDIHIIGYDIVLTEIMKERPQVLIIGNYVENAPIEKRIVEYLHNYDIDIFIKSHPLVSNDKYNKLRSVYKFQMVENNIFPRVDLVFSYSSTLALEYESCGIQVVYYTEIFFDNTVLIEKNIKKYIDKLFI